MLHADSFALGDSMSALEMMDPKMDAGLLNPTVIPAGLSHPDAECWVPSLQIGRSPFVPRVIPGAPPEEWSCVKKEGGRGESHARRDLRACPSV